MPIAFTLVSATPNGLRYLCDDDGSGGQTTLANATMLADARTASGFGGLPLVGILTTAVASQAEARHLMLGDASTNAPNNANLARCRCTITMRSLGVGGPKMAVDADAVGGEPVLLITSTGDEAPEAYLDIHYEHSYDDGPDGTGA